VSGNLDLGMLNFAEAESQIKAGDVRPMMVLAARRLKVLPDVPTAKELGIEAEYDTVRGFVALKGTPEDRLKVLEEGLIKAMKGQMYSAYIETSGQAAESVVGRAAWQAQLDAMYKEAESELKTLAAAPK
jgi:tripartite-type tricarboxylate transporter receptor subunit TctC